VGYPNLLHAPSPRKPARRADPTGPEWQRWRAASAASAISRQGAQRLTHLREAIDQFSDGALRPLLVCADATFTNRTVLRDLPPRTTLLGRIRKDARLYALPTSEEENRSCGRGRRRCYGQRLPTPEQLRRDDSIQWKTVQAFAAGNIYDFDSSSSLRCAGKTLAASGSCRCSSSDRSPTGCARVRISATAIRLT
jgi:hypothetical protein